MKLLSLYLALFAGLVVVAQKGQRKTSLLIDPPAQPDLPSAAAAKSASAAAGLNLTNIQGDILVGMKKNKELFFFFNIVDATTFKTTLRNDILPSVTTVTDLLSVSSQPITALNFALSHAGLSALGVTDNLQDTLFNAGQAAGASNLGDPGTGNWVSGFSTVHGVIILASDTDANIDTRLAALLTSLGSSITEVHRLRGAARPGSEQGHEHFGFMDGVSQPAVDGFSANVVPGQDTVATGVILVGETGDSLASSRPAWARDGSFLAFRQLQQMVPEFNQFLMDNALTAGGLTVQQGADLLGARMVGRWKSGAPIDLSPTADNAALASDPSMNNNFDFKDPITGSVDDESRCPFSAHIRKTAPRGDLAKANVDPHRILRAGIPYGPEVSADEAAAHTTSTERGLAFVCYQSNLNQGFAFLQSTWANNAFFLGHPSNSQPGFDPIIGANKGAARTMSGMDPSNPTATKTMLIDFVVSRGGEYFFSPSLSAIRDTLSV